MPDPTPPPVRTPRIVETSLYGPDLDALEDFYRDVIGLTAISRFGRRGAALRCGRGVLLLFDPSEAEQPDGPVPPHGARGAGHVAFAATHEELPAWRSHLASRGVEIEAEVEWGSGRSIYFRDPAGNSVELATPGLWDDIDG